VRQPDTVLSGRFVLLEFAQGVTSEEAVAEATRLGLDRPIYEDALAFGAAYPACRSSARWCSSTTPGSASSAGGT
jgi:hypothetical protein